MGRAKEKWAEGQEKDPKHWITRKCAVCGTPVKLNTVLDSRRADPKEPFTCNECLNKD